jgi:hypothetical protein
MDMLNHRKGNPTMATINIDGKEYDTNLLSTEAKAHLVTLQYIDNELKRLQVQMSVHQTARNTYINALKQQLAPVSGETIKLS